MSRFVTICHAYVTAGVYCKPLSPSLRHKLDILPTTAVPSRSTEERDGDIKTSENPHFLGQCTLGQANSHPILFIRQVVSCTNNTKYHVRQRTRLRRVSRLTLDRRRSSVPRPARPHGPQGPLTPVVTNPQVDRPRGLAQPKTPNST